MSSNRIEITEEFDLPIPRNNQLLIEEVSGERVKGSIVIPNVGEKVAAVGKVLAVGASVTDIPVGSYVLCNRYAGVELDYINRKLRVVPERDVTCFLERAEDTGDVGASGLPPSPDTSITLSTPVKVDKVVYSEPVAHHEPE